MSKLAEAFDILTLNGVTGGVWHRDPNATSALFGNPLAPDRGCYCSIGALRQAHTGEYRHLPGHADPDGRWITDPEYLNDLRLLHEAAGYPVPEDYEGGETAHLPDTHLEDALITWNDALFVKGNHTAIRSIRELMTAGEFAAAQQKVVAVWRKALEVQSE